jgi:hypothetical protein
MTADTADHPSAEAPGDRGHFIPVRKTDILDALTGPGQVAGQVAGQAVSDPFRQVCRLLAAIFHYEYFAQLEALREDYFYFNPEIAPHAQFDRAAGERAYANLIAALARVAEDANFIELSHAEIAKAHRERVLTRVDIEAPLGDYREVRVFRRGRHKETIEHADWFGLRKRSSEVSVFDDVVLFVAIKPAADIVSDRDRKRLAQRKIRPGSVLIKYFHNIASADINALFPHVRVVMSLRDKLLLSGPALIGGLPILLKLASTITVLFLVIGFYLGLSGSMKGDEMAAAFAAVSGLVALGGFVMRQWLRYRHQALKYQKELTDNIYFRNANNNAGIFDAMIGAAEDQECKEAFLAYWFLCTATASSSPSDLKERIEGWLRRTFGIEVDFAVAETLARLDRLGLLVRERERLAVLPPEPALRRLDQAWDGFFGAAPAAAGA